jgi:ADP-ribosylation factor-like protein 8
MGAALFRSLFSKKLEVAIIGLGNSGKTTLLHMLADGTAVETIPTVGLNVRMIQKGGVKMKCWDLAGGQQYLSTVQGHNRINVQNRAQQHRESI